MSELQKRAVQRAIEDALDLPAIDKMRDIVCHSTGASAGARIYADQHPDDEDAAEGSLWCCESAVYRGLAHCTCWEPIYDVAQMPPMTDTVPGVMTEKCHDCAFRPGSPERSDEYLRDELYALPAKGEPFWCHQGLRQPARWRHKTLGLEVPGDPADWQPPIVDGVPYLADGRAGNLCAGWVALRLAAVQGDTTGAEASP